MSSMVDKLKYNIGSLVSISDENLEGKIVDIVNNGQYRIETENGLFVVNEEDIQLIEDNKPEIDESMIIEGKLMQYAKEFFKKMNKKEPLKESLRQNDLEHLISPYVSIDQYTSKISEDNLTIAFFCNERDVASDLSDFLEKMYFMEIRDIEVSESMTEDNKYILYVEFDRNQQFPKILIDILDSINFLINKKMEDWDFKSFNMKNKAKVSIDALKKYVRLSPLDIQHEKSKNIKQESVEYTKDNLKRTYIDEGYISVKEFEKIIEESELDMGISLDREVLSYNFPMADVITTDTHAFVIHGNKIKKLGF